MLKVNKIILFILVFIIMSGFACVSVISQDEKNSWLQSKLQKPSSIDIEGVWEEDMGYYGWGNGFFKQNGDKVTGSFGGYEIDGIVSGDDVYLLFSYRGQIRYAAHFNPVNDNGLVGYYYKNIDLRNGHNMLLSGKLKKK